MESSVPRSPQRSRILWWAFAASCLALPAALFLGYFLYVAPLEEKALSEGALGVARDIDALLDGKAVVVEGALGRTDVEKFRESELLDKLLRRILKRTPDFLSLELIDPEGVIVARLGEFNLSEEGLPSHVNVAKLGALDSMPDHKRWLFKDDPRLSSFYLITRKSAKEGASFYYLRLRFSRESLVSTLKRAELRGLSTSLTEWESPGRASRMSSDGDGKKSPSSLDTPQTPRVTVVRTSRFAQAGAEVPLEARGWRISVKATDSGGPSTLALISLGLLALLPLALAGIAVSRSGGTTEAEQVAALGEALTPRPVEEHHEAPVKTSDSEERTPIPAEETQSAKLECEPEAAKPRAGADNLDETRMNETAQLHALAAAAAEAESDDPARQEEAPLMRIAGEAEATLREATAAAESPADPIAVESPSAPPESTLVTALVAPRYMDDASDELVEQEACAGSPTSAQADMPEGGATRDHTTHELPQSAAIEEPPPDLPWFEVVVEADRRLHAEAANSSEKGPENVEDPFPEYLEVDLGVEDAHDPALGTWEKARTRTFHRLRDFISAHGAN